MIEIYTRDNCAFCAKAKEFLKLENASYFEYNISKGDVTREEIFARLNKSTEDRVTLPVVFIDNEYIGGYEQLAEYFAGLAIEKQALTDALLNGVLEIEFTKADGTLRKMNASLQTKYIEKASYPVSVSSMQAALNQNGITSPRTLSIIDVDKNEWRRFRLDRLKSWKQVESA